MLRFEKVSKLLGILTNASVLVGLVFLIIEINQNTEFLEFEKETRSISDLVESTAILYMDESFADALFKDPESRTPVEEWRLVTSVRGSFNSMQRAWREGYFESNPDLVALYKLAFYSDDPRGVLLRQTWELHKAVLMEGFIEWFENNVVNET